MIGRKKISEVLWEQSRQYESLSGLYSNLADDLTTLAQYAMELEDENGTN